MKILLIAPKNPESFWTFDRILPTLGKKCIYPNLSLPTVAGLTPAEHEVVLCDENVEPIDFDTDADIVGITGYVVHRRRILQIVEAFKKRGKLVVAGGPFASLCPEELRGKVDVVFIDEAEYTWPRFLRDYAEGVWQAEYQQIEKTNMTDSPLPRFDLLQVEAYQTMTIQFARGCPFTCEFCDIIVMYGRKPRTKSIEQVMAEVREVHRLGVSNIFVVDDNFIGNKKEAKALLKALVAWQGEHRYPIEFMTEVTLNIAQDDELLSLLRQANFRSVFVGIESPRETSLRETKKTQNLRQDIREAVGRIQRAGIEVMAGMIVGFDHDDPTIFDEHLRFIQEARIPVSMTGMLNALPRTPLYTRLEAAGRLAAQCTGDQFDLTNIVPERMSRLQLFEGYRALLQRLYDYPSYYERSLALILGKGGEDIRSGVGLNLHDLSSLARFLWSCILRAPPRRAWMTSKLLLETARRRPAELRMAVTLALLHKHFYEYVQDVCARLDVLIDELRNTADTGPTHRTRLCAEQRA
jgi:radical SAM superfamily enzyme YgiQ (UPF0313 family)